MSAANSTTRRSRNIVVAADLIAVERYAWRHHESAANSCVVLMGDNGSENRFVVLRPILPARNSCNGAIAGSTLLEFHNWETFPCSC